MIAYVCMCTQVLVVKTMAALSTAGAALPLHRRPCTSIHMHTVAYACYSNSCCKCVGGRVTVLHCCSVRRYLSCSLRAHCCCPHATEASDTACEVACTSNATLRSDSQARLGCCMWLPLSVCRECWCHVGCMCWCECGIACREIQSKVSLATRRDRWRITTVVLYCTGHLNNPNAFLQHVSIKTSPEHVVCSLLAT